MDLPSQKYALEGEWEADPTSQVHNPPSPDLGLSPRGALRLTGGSRSSERRHNQFDTDKRVLSVKLVTS